MTAHSSQSPEDRFNAYLDALASGRSTPDASDLFAGSYSDPFVPTDVARELHDLAKSAEARRGDLPDQIWETILDTGTASAAFPVSPTDPWTVPKAPTGSPSRASEGAPSGRSRRKSRQIGRWLNAIAAGVLLLGIAAGWYFSGIGPGGSERGGGDGQFAALPAMQSATPSGDTASDVERCLADNGLVYRTSEPREPAAPQYLATSVDGEDRPVATDALMVFASGQNDIAIGVSPTEYTARNLLTDTTTALGVTGDDLGMDVLFGPWIVAPANASGTDWAVTYLPTMDQTSVASALPESDVSAFSVSSKVSADGSTLALVVTPDQADASGSGDARPVAPMVYVVMADEPQTIHQLPMANPDLAHHTDLVAVSADGSLVSAPTVGGTGTGDLYIELDVWSVDSLPGTLTVVALPPLDYPVHEGFAFFSPDSEALHYVVNGTINTLRLDEVDRSQQTSTYDGALYGAVIAPGGEGALVGVRGGPAVSPSVWLWIDGATGEPSTVQHLENFMSTEILSADDKPPVVVAALAELTTSDRESGPSIVFFDVAAGTVESDLRKFGDDRVGGVSGYEMFASSDGSLLLTRLDDEAFIKARRLPTGEFWQIPVPEGVPTPRLGAIPSPDGACIALYDEGALTSDGPQPIWVVAAKPGAEPVLVADGWFSNWYEEPVSLGD